MPILETLVAIGAGSLLAWLAVLALPARPWDLRPIGEDEPPPPEPERWPSVCVLVPARNEAALLPQSLPALVAQDDPGEWHVVVVDDRSADGTAAVARVLATNRVSVVDGASLPEGWAGKVWALEQGLRAAGPVDYLVRRDALERAGGFAAILDEVINDVNLARRVQQASGRLRLSVSRADVVSLRRYGSIGSVYSWLRLLGTVAGLALLFLVPPGLIVAGAAWTGAGTAWRVALAGLGVAAWAALAAAILPTVRYFGLRPLWALTLPLGGVLYGGMTVDSAIRHWFERSGW